MGKYIIELKNRETLYKAAIKNGEPYVTIALGKPYTEPDLEQVRKEAYEKGRKDVETQFCSYDACKNRQEEYQRGLADAWEAARKIVLDTDKGGIPISKLQQIFHKGWPNEIIGAFSASEALEEIRAHEQAQKEKEEQEEKDFVTTEEVMRHYLDTFCKRNFCTKCILHTPDFTCGRGYSFLTNSPVSDEEVRRAYAAVIAKLKE